MTQATIGKVPFPVELLYSGANVFLFESAVLKNASKKKSLFERSQQRKLFLLFFWSDKFGYGTAEKSLYTLAYLLGRISHWRCCAVRWQRAHAIVDPKLNHVATA